MARGPANTAALTVMDEVYTFSMNSWNRKNVRVLTSIDYEKMPAEVKAQEPANGKRTDGDYALSYIQKEGNGRIFVQVLGHHESIYKMRPMLEHILAGMQYAIGDLNADDKSDKLNARGLRSPGYFFVRTPASMALISALVTFSDEAVPSMAVRTPWAL